MEVFKKSFFLLRYVAQVCLLVLIVPLGASAGQQFTTVVDFSYQKDEFKYSGSDSKRWSDRFQQDYNTNHYGYLFHPRLFPLSSTANFSTSKHNNDSNQERKVDNYYFSGNTTILPTTRYPVNLDFKHTLNKDMASGDSSSTTIGAQWDLNFDYFPTTYIFAQNQRNSSFGAETNFSSYGFRLSKDEGKEIIFGRTRFTLAYRGGGGAGSNDNQGTTTKNGSVQNLLSFTSTTNFTSRSNFEQGLDYNTSESLNRNSDGSSVINTGSQHISYKSSLNLRPTPYLTQQYGYQYSMIGFNKSKNASHNGTMNIKKVLSSRLSVFFSSGYGFRSTESFLQQRTSESTSSSASAGANLKITNYLGSGYSLFFRNSESTSGSTVTGLNHSTAIGTNASLRYGRLFFKLLNFSNSLSGAISKTKKATSSLGDSETKDETISNSGSLGLSKGIFRIVNATASGTYSVTRGNQADITPEKATLDMDRDMKSHNYSLGLRNIILDKYISINGGYEFTADEQKSNDQNGEFYSNNANKSYKLTIGIPYFTSFSISGSYQKRQRSSSTSNQEEDSQDYNVSFGFSRYLLGGEFSTNSNYLRRVIQTDTSQNLTTNINYSRGITRFMFGNFQIVRNESWNPFGVKDTSTSYKSRITYQLRRWTIGFNYDYSIGENNRGRKEEHTYLFANITRVFSRTFF